MFVIAFLSGVVVLLWVIFAACLPAALRFARRIPLDARPSMNPRVSVIVPARNEEQVLPHCLAALASQDLPPFEVIVVDDDSTDATRAVAERAGVQVLTSPPKPAGWMGKTWAAWQGAQVARGDWLLFIDADVRLAPAALRATMAASERRGAALLTAIARAECSSFFEALVQPTAGLLVMSHLNPRKVNDPKTNHASASGAFLLFRREAYEAVGGHKAVCNQLMDDYQLALAVKAHNMPLFAVNATHLVSFRRRQSTRDVWHHWRRVFGGGLAGRRWLALAIALAVALGFSGPHAAAIASWIALGATPMVCLLLGLAAAQTGVSWIVGWMMSRAFGMDLRYVVLQPIGALFSVAWIASAAFAPVGAGARLRWRGRDLKV